MNNKAYVLYATNIEDYLEDSVDTNLLVFKNRETAYSIADKLNKCSPLNDVMRRVLEKVCDDKQIIYEIMDLIFEYYRDGQIKFYISELPII